MATWWLIALASQAASGDDLATFDLAKVKGTADACAAGEIPTGNVVVCARRKEMNVTVKPIDWSERPVRAAITLPGGITASSTVEQRSPGPPGVSVPTPMVHLKLKF